MEDSLLIEKEWLLFVKYTIPSVLSMIGFSLYILADTYFVANGVGAIGLSALNIAIPVYGFMAAIAILLGMGGSTLFSIYRGKGDFDSANDVFSMSMFNCAVVSTVILLLGIFASKYIAILLGASGIILDYVEVYLKVIMILCPLMIFSNVLINFVRNDGKPKVAMVAMIIGTALNIACDYIFIYIFKWGMFGAALATSFSPIISLIIGLYFIKNSTLKLKKFKYKYSMLKESIHCGISSFLSEVSISVVILIFNIVILDISGEMAVAAYGIITNIALVCLCMFNGLAQGMQPIISTNFGSNERTRMLKVLKMGIIVALILGIIFYAVGMIYPKEITEAFNGQGSAILTNLTINGIRIYFIAFIFMGVNIVILSFYQSIMKAKEAFILSVLRGFLLIVVLLLILTPLWGMNGVWLVVPITELITLVLSSISLIKYLNSEKNPSIEVDYEKSEVVSK